MRALFWLAASLALAAPALPVAAQTPPPVNRAGAIAKPGAQAAPKPAAVAPTLRSWSFAGPIGSYDLASAQRGFAVFQQECSSCHTLRGITYDDLGGIGLRGDQIEAIAASVMVPGAPDANGMPTLRPASPADGFRDPYPNPAAARAANAGALPPDLAGLVPGPVAASRMQSFLLGYQPTPPNVSLLPGLAYNVAWPGHTVAMPQVLKDGAITFADGSRSSVTEMAHDVTTFLAYAADPHRVWRERLGVQLLLFFLILTAIVWIVHRRAWSRDA